MTECDLSGAKYLFADSAPGVSEDGVLVSRHRRIKLFQNNLDTAVAMHKAADMVYHGGFTVHAGALVRWPALHTQKHKSVLLGVA